MLVNAVWIGDELPLLQRVCLQSWIRHGHEVHLWHYEPALFIPDGVISRNAREIMEGPIRRYTDRNHEGSPILHANLFRYLFLAHRGGAFIDADTLCLANFKFTRMLFSSEGPRKHPNWAFVYLPEASTEFAKRCADVAFSRLDKPKWGGFGPRLLAEQIEMFGMSSCVVEPELFCPIHWSDAQQITDEEQPLINGAFGVHLWSQVLSQKGIDLEATHPVSSLWEGWRSAYWKGWWASYDR